MKRIASRSRAGLLVVVITVIIAVRPALVLIPLLRDINLILMRRAMQVKRAIEEACFLVAGKD